MAIAQDNRWTPGQLVSARNRDWVVLPQDDQDVALLRPVDGSEEDAIGIFLPLEPTSIRPSEYQPPDPENVGNFASARLLLNAMRLRLRSGAGPFRSMGRLSVVPRPYQFVPLVMSLRLDPVRLLIADDVGVGKTIEAAMIARELLDRGIVRRLGVLCAPHLCEQWEEELRTKFNIEAAVIQSSRIGRLERALPRGDISLYQYYRHLVVSIDYIKSERNRGHFLANAPDLIIVDEAHTAARPAGTSGRSRHQRHELVRDLAEDSSRHLILTTATPHSGIEESFLSLLGLLNPEFEEVGDSGASRRRLAPHIIQRKRTDLASWLGADTPFPRREAVERSYRMSKDYHRLYEDILSYCREYVTSEALIERRQRVRYWAALSILRCVLSSPMAARAALENRKSKSNERDSAQQGDDDPGVSSAALMERLMDSADEDQATDYIFTAPDEASALSSSEVRRLDGFLRRADALSGRDNDAKIRETAHVVSDLLDEGYSPIVYCRFIQTAYYVAEQLQNLLARRHPGLLVRAVSGNDGDSEQRKGIALSLANEPTRVLVATDCLSEGVNLQDHYNAIVHYDLPWNPNRLEQREGRVDRFGQHKDVVKTVLLYGSDNEIDLVVLDALLRKAKAIRERLGISVPVPVESDQVVSALISSVLLRGLGQGRQFRLAFEDEEVSRLHQAWDRMTDREEKSQSFYAQGSVQPEEVSRELREMEPALGSASDTRSFLAEAIQRFNGDLRSTRTDGVFRLLAGELSQKITARDSRLTFPLDVSFDGVPRQGSITLGRNHPVIETTADAVIANALSGDNPNFARSSAIVTQAVSRRTAVLVLRLRYLIEAGGPQFAEEITAAAFTRAGGEVSWLTPLQGEAMRVLREAEIEADMSVPERQEHVRWALESLEDGWADGIIAERSEALGAAHDRLSKVVKRRRTRVKPHMPPDIIGCYVLVPAGA